MFAFNWTVNLTTLSEQKHVVELNWKQTSTVIKIL